jgi:sugar transferase (PEP-CTERM/EpsH1 system associated)
MGAFLLPPRGVPRVMHFAELDSDKWRQYAESRAFPASWIYAREARTLLAFETRLAREVDANVFCTALEERIFHERIPGPNSMVLRNGVDLEFFRPAPEAAEPDHLIFVGVMDYPPNVDGCAWFVHEILPEVRRRVPAVRLAIVGARPSRAVRALASVPGVTVTGFVDDTRTWLRRSSVSIAPLRLARGIQNKVLEAMAMGLPVVGTIPATQGVEGVPGQHFLLADTVQAQVDAVCGLLEDRARARALGAEARRFVEAHYDWERCLEPLDGLVDRLTSARRSAWSRISGPRDTGQEPSHP